MYDLTALQNRNITDLHGPNRRGVRMSVAETLCAMVPGDTLTATARALLSAATRSERAWLLASMRVKAKAATFAAIAEAARTVLSEGEIARLLGDGGPQPPFGVAA